MSRWLQASAALEAITGLGLVLAPALVVLLLAGSELSGPGLALGRLAGLALLSLGLACWPGRDAGNGTSAALRAMLTYNPLATLYLGYLGTRGEWFGGLLWPAVAIHAAATLLLFRSLLRTRPVM
jgi:hypothetical protein